MSESRREADRRWAREQIEQYRAVLPRYQTYARTLHRVLEAAVRQHAPGAIVQVRVKSVPSFAEKIQRKRHKYGDPVRQLTDLCGGRVIVHTRAEVEAVSTLIETHYEVDWENSLDVSQRLQPAEFGYRSVHYVVRFVPGLLPTPAIPVDVPEELMGLKAEIQVRTLLEHAWATFSHDRAYKGAFPLPAIWQRQLAGLAALLEETDRDFARIQDGLETYACSYGAYLTPGQMLDEMELLEIVLAVEPEDPVLAHRVGRLAMTLGEWDKAVQVLSEHIGSGYRPLLRDLGVCLCKLYRDDPTGERYRQGQRWLEKAGEPPRPDVDALASLASSWKGVDDERARNLYHQALQVDPSNSYALSNYLVLEVAHRRDRSLGPMLQPTIRAAMQRDRQQADLGINLPWAFFDLATFHLLLGNPNEALVAAAKAVQLSTADWMIATSVQLLANLAGLSDSLPGWEWVHRLLLVGWAARFPSPAALEAVARLATAGARRPPGRVVIVAGGCDPDLERQMQDYRPLLLEAFRGFRGTLVCGGTLAGISRLVGDVQQAFPDSVHTLGYLPASVGDGIPADHRYRELRTTASPHFGPLEPLQAWIDLVAAGVPPREVRLLAINGGAIAAAEFRMALALGAVVGVVEGSGRQAARLLTDEDWNKSAALVRLPADPLTLRAFLEPGSSLLVPDLRETLARAIHQSYCADQAARRPAQDPAAAPWDQLPEPLRESNRRQADHLAEMLGQIGWDLHPVARQPEPPLVLTDEEVERLAELEHARWMVERLLDGWRWGPQRDVAGRISPSLVAWSSLPAETQAQNRQAVRQMPALAARANLEIRRTPPA